MAGGGSSNGGGTNGVLQKMGVEKEGGMLQHIDMKSDARTYTRTALGRVFKQQQLAYHRLLRRRRRRFDFLRTSEDFQNPDPSLSSSLPPLLRLNF